MRFIFALLALIYATTLVSAALVANPRRTPWVKSSSYRTTDTIKGRQCQLGDYVYQISVSRILRPSSNTFGEQTWALYRVKIYCRNKSGSSRYSVGATGFNYLDQTEFSLGVSEAGIRKLTVKAGEIVDGIQHLTTGAIIPNNGGVATTLYTATNIIGVEWAYKEPGTYDQGFALCNAIRFLYV